MHPKNKRRTALAELAVALIIIRYQFGINTVLNKINIHSTAVLLIIICLLLGVIFTGSFSLFDIIICLVVLISFCFSRDDTVMLTVLFAEAAKSLNQNALIKVWAYIHALILGICTISYVILYAMGSPLAVANWIDGRFRYYFMYQHPNIYSIQLVFTILAFAYIYANKLSRPAVTALLLVPAAFIWFFPKSRSAVYILIIAFVFRFLGWHALRFYHFLCYAIPVLIIIGISVSVMLLYTGYGDIVSRFLTGPIYSRFNDAVIMMRRYPVNLFGHNLSDIGELVRSGGEWNTTWLDLAYVHLLLSYGAVFSILFFLLFFGTIFFETKNNQNQKAGLLLLTAIYAISEWSSFYIASVFSLIFLSDVLLALDKAWGSAHFKRH